MTVRLAILTGALVACTTSVTPPDPCTAPVATGEYELSIVSLENFRVGHRFEMASTGVFEGFSDNMAYSGDFRRCAGALTSAEQDALTAAINEADTFCQPSWPEFGADAYSYDVTIRTLDGTRENRFCAFSDGSHPTFERIIRVIHDPLRAAEAAGSCTEPMYDVGRTTDLCPRPAPRP